jgi:hypothetical protein
LELGTSNAKQGCHIGRPKQMRWMDGHNHLSFKCWTYRTYFLNILWKYLEYAQICSNISLSNKHDAYQTNKMDGQSKQTFGCMNNLVLSKMLQVCRNRKLHSEEQPHLVYEFLHRAYICVDLWVCRRSGGSGKVKFIGSCNSKWEQKSFELEAGMEPMFLASRK